MRMSRSLGSSLCFLLATSILPVSVFAQSEETSLEVTSQAETAYPGGIELIESVERTGDEITIPYKKFRLPNGLTLVLHADDSDPLVHVDVTYHVGSGREDVGKSGFAHFFEHMMFQGSENVADEEHFKIVSESGGTLNGTTNSDRTNYFQTVPANQLEKVLWLEADRMGFFLDAVTQEKFEVQRETVKNERGQRVDNAPYGRLFERVGEAMFPEGHPYSWSTIGYIEDLNRADLDDLKRFFLRWYGPNNAVLTIGGRMDEMEALALVAKYFGSIPEGPAVEDPVYTPVTLAEDRYISMEDNVQLPLLYMAWPSVHVRHPDEAPLDVLNSILGQGRTSLMYKNLVKDGQAVQAQANHYCRELNCSFTLLALPNPASGTSLTDIDQIIRASLEEFETRGVEDDDLERVKAGIVSSMVFGLESVSGKVSQLAYYETFHNNPNLTAFDVDRYENVTKADVMRVYETYIKDKASVVMSIVPTGQIETIAAPDSWERYERTIPESTGEEEGLALRVATDTFDRSVQPSASDVDLSIKVPELWRGELVNGIAVLGAINDETPTTAISIDIKVGQRSEPLDKLGLAALTVNMLEEATVESTNEELANRLAKLGSSISIGAGDYSTTITVRSLTENLSETLAIAAERLYSPAFNEEDFERLKGQTLQGIKQSKTNASTTASAVYNRILFGADNAFAYPGAGLEATIATITLEDVKAFYEANYSAAIAQIISVSDLGQDAIMEELGIFADWEATPVTIPDLADFPELETDTIYLIDKPEAAQSEIRIGKRALPYDATGEYYRARLMNFVLGGAFNSRINLNLREDKGYSYGAWSYFRGEKDYGEYRAQAGVRTDASAASITEFLKEIKAYRQDGITAEELTFTKNAVGQRDARDYETPSQKLGFLDRIQTYNLPDGFVDEQKRILNEMTAEEVNALAEKYLDIDEMVIIIMGDKATILPSLIELGYQIDELDAEGNLIAENLMLEAEEDSEASEEDSEASEEDTEADTSKPRGS